MYLFYDKEYNTTEDSIRFRVIANSNSSRDIIMKEKVVSDLSSFLFINSNDKQEVRNNIYSNLENIDKRINNIFKTNNYDQKYNISYGYNEFPKKTFMGKTYPEGLYESLVIEIGDAKGNNYFCILYPSLCVLDYENTGNNYGFRFVNMIKKIL